ncbi:uncharacterized protein N7515_006864 [Penicillium bovifimosum]|uniref:Uncharacterized protein n=1 Tax=Penicillium bovifimosum TaxID=126998 RepID=A0A9W9GVH5_9EURO|nr:uncharacterized protein N7515_006864 [Penicillium bovifimosum]KAJ5130825.1 hypothetical protein N7515_006864 [Penicillium bovifimosum]
MSNRESREVLEVKVEDRARWGGEEEIKATQIGRTAALEPPSPQQCIRSIWKAESQMKIKEIVESNGLE